MNRPSRLPLILVKRSPRTSRTGGPGRAGFTLVELLMVISILLVLTAVSGAVMRAFTGGGSLRRGVYDMASLLELARNQAVARQTYVWVGFQNNDGEVCAAAVYSINGSGADPSPVNWTRVVRVKNASLIGWSQLKAATRDYASQLFGQAAPIDPESVDRSGGGSANAGIAFKAGVTQFTGNTVTFTPRGEALIKGAVGPDDGYDPCIDISFREARGEAVPANADDASILIDGATGSVQVVQIQ